MEKLILTIAVNVLALVFLGWTFALVEKNEDLDTELERKRNDLWHRTKAITLGLLLANIAYNRYGFGWDMVILTLNELSLIPLVFNSSINLFKGNGFFYLSKEGFEGNFHEPTIVRIAYFLFFLVVFVGTGYLLILKNYTL